MNVKEELRQNDAGNDSDEEPPDLIEMSIDEGKRMIHSQLQEPQPPQEKKENTTLSSSSPPETVNDSFRRGTPLLPPCPVSILSGFLGSGKTTLIQYILKSPDHGKRIAVIENEFGEGLAVESMIARDGVDPQSSSLQDFVELPNGCICCTVKDSLVVTLERLIQKRSDLDYILIEASGMANPGPIASVFWLDDALQSRLKLDGIITLVDGVHILKQLATTEEAAQQIAYADRIILNKVDLLEQEKKKTPHSDGPTADDVESKLRQLHPTAPILRTSFSKIPDLDWILGADCFGGSDRLEELESIWDNAGLPSGNQTPLGQDGSHGHSHSHHGHDGQDCQDCQHQAHENAKENHHHHHHHTESISTIAFQQPGSLDLVKLNAWLADILWPNQDEMDKVLTSMLSHPSTAAGVHSMQKESMQQQEIFRIKGIVSAAYREDYDIDEEKERQNRQNYCLADTGLDRRRFIVQAVHDLWEVYPGSDDLIFQPGEKRVCKLVVIGKHLKEQELRSGFQNCFSKKEGLVVGSNP